MSRVLSSTILLCFAAGHASGVAAGDHPAATAPAGVPRTLRLPEVPHRYGRDDLPAHFRTPAARAFDSTPAANPITDWGATLGRVLFYDTRLSANATVSCASCHQQERAFADSRRFMAGHGGATTDRNGMSLVNLRFAKAGFFWDIRAATLEQQVLVPIQSRVEMGQKLNDLRGVIERDERYPPLFEKAFDDPEVTPERITRALAQFVRSLVSCRSRYDAGLAAVDSVADDFPDFTPGENLGKTVFLEKCAICHTDGRGSQSAFFSMFTALNNGIDRTGSEPDAGRGDLTLIPSDVGLFKPSDLRNVEHTAPYMHDGRFGTLEEVVEHYSNGVNRHPNVSPFVFRMHFGDREKAGLVAFLKTLSDEAFLNDPRFADPWHAGPAASEVPQVVAASSSAPAAGPQPSGPRTADDGARRRSDPIGEPLSWLRSLDSDGDGALSRVETETLAKLLLERGSPPRFDRRRFSAGSLRIARGAEAPPVLLVYDQDKDGRLGRDEVPESRRHLIDAGDTDGDGRLNLDEIRAVEAVERFVSLQANDRDRARIGRLVQSLRLPEGQAVALNHALHQVKADHERRAKARDATLVARLGAAMGAGPFAAFQLAMLARQDARELARGGEKPAVESAQDQVFEFDRDRDGRLGRAEQATLAAALDEMPGGFGSERGTLPTVKQFSSRMMARDGDRDGLVDRIELPERMWPVLMPADADGDGALSPRELDDYLRRTGFERLVGEGIYTGGGFVNAFSRASRLLPELDLPSPARGEAAGLLNAHERQVRAALAEAVVSACRLLRDVRQGAAGARPKTPPRSLREDHP